jgi:hypothetical protein
VHRVVDAVGRRIAEERAHHGWTQEEAAVARKNGTVRNGARCYTRVRGYAGDAKVHRARKALPAILDGRRGQEVLRPDGRRRHQGPGVSPLRAAGTAQAGRKVLVECTGTQDVGQPQDMFVWKLKISEADQLVRTQERKERVAADMAAYRENKKLQAANGGKPVSQGLQSCILTRDLEAQFGPGPVPAGTRLDETLYELVYYPGSERLVITEKTVRPSRVDRRRGPPAKPRSWPVEREEIDDSDPPLPTSRSRGR